MPARSKPTDIHLLVTLHANASVTVTRLPLDAVTIEPTDPPYEVLVQGRSLSDVMKAIEAAALEAQGRTS